jgi:rhodanese-related sulfurtransferase
MADSIRISPADAKVRLDAGEALVLDVVSPAAWDHLDVAIPGALRIPPDELASHLVELPRDRDVIAYCT